MIVLKQRNQTKNRFHKTIYATFVAIKPGKVRKEKHLSQKVLVNETCDKVAKWEAKHMFAVI